MNWGPSTSELWEKVSELEAFSKEMRYAVEQLQNIDDDRAQSVEQLKKENHDLKLHLATLIRLLVSKGVLTAGEVGSTVAAIEKG